MVRVAQEYITAGDIYQVCLSHSFEARVLRGCMVILRIAETPFGRALRRISRSRRHANNFCVPGRCFLPAQWPAHRDPPHQGQWPVPRRADAQRDQRNAYDLITSVKEIAELVMITDLERNDLGQVCEYGSVTVPELLKLESYEQVHHLVSTVAGTLREDVAHSAALRACFPGGSISGAPKKRALEIISELEPHPRGIYTGAIGYFGYNGESQFSIAIRTAVFENGRASFHVGAGIVADSTPERGNGRRHWTRQPDFLWPPECRSASSRVFALPSRRGYLADPPAFPKLPFNDRRTNAGGAEWEWASLRGECPRGAARACVLPPR